MARRPSSFSRQLWLAVFFLNLTMALMLGWSFLYLEPGTPSYVIGQVSAAIVLTTLVGSLLALYSGWEPL